MSQLKLIRLLREEKIRECRNSFWTFCKVMDSNNNPTNPFFEDDKTYLKDICDTLQALYEGRLIKPDGNIYKRAQLNCPPGFGKSYCLILFSQWLFGKDKRNEIISVSYNEKITTKFGQAVRDGIEQEQDESDLSAISYNDIFPETKIKYGDASKRDWSLEGRHHSYLATSFKGTCFPGETLVTTSEGDIRIDDLSTLKEMPLALSLCHKTNQISYKPILAAKRSIYHELIELNTESGRALRCTPDHRIYKGNRYVEARYLKVGDILTTFNKCLSLDTDIIASITTIKEKDYVYDIEVEGHHNFFANNILVHNCTGIRGNVGINDDPIKNAYEANNAEILEEHWEWYKNTFRSRLVEGAIQIVLMTRWSTKDLCGKLLEHSPDDWYVMKYEVMNEETGEMLCEKIVSRESYEDIKATLSPDIFRANYHQEPVDIKGLLYPELQTYTELPDDIEGVYAQVDTADTGKDALIAIVYARSKGRAYILDMYYSIEGMKVTEPATAKLLYDNNVDTAEIESNNGGSGFARNVERLLWENHKTRKTKIKWFHQSLNKKTKILTNASNVMNTIFFPQNWDRDYREIYAEVSTYNRTGKNKHDDCEDVLSEIAMRLVEKKKTIVTSKRRLGIS